MTLGENFCGRGAPTVAFSGSLEHLDGARAIGQTLDEAALFERQDQAVDAAFGLEVKAPLSFHRTREARLRPAAAHG